jgi:hypothetical protein
VNEAASAALELRAAALDAALRAAAAVPVAALPA